MSYKMRFRVTILLINPQNAEAEAGADDTTLIQVGDVTSIPNPDGTWQPNQPTGPVITSLNQAVSAVMSVNRGIQRGLKTNVRFKVEGLPVGTPEIPDNDIPAEYKVMKTYIIGDTPNAGLLYYISRANKKPSQAVASGFVPVDVFPEVPADAEPIGGGG